MSTATLLKLTRWAMLAAIVFCVAAIFYYPGGTRLDQARVDYSWSQNFVSDLGMTVTHGGRPNRAGAALFTIGFGLMALSFATGAAAFVRLHASSSPRSRRFALAAAFGGLLVAVTLGGTAVYSADQAPLMHMRLAAAASVIATMTAWLFAMASAADDRAPASITIVWLVLGTATAVWFTAGWWGPDGHTPSGLTFYATLQKLVALTVVGGLLHQQRTASRI